LKINWRKIFVLSVLIIFGCAGSRQMSKIKINTAAELQKYFTGRDAKIHTFTGSGSITIETPESANNARFNVKIKKPDSLLIELTGPFGISVGTLMLSRQSYIFYNSLENRVQRGSAGINSLKPIVNLDFSFDDVINLFTGSYLYSSIDFSKANFETYENKFSLKEYNLPSIKEVSIDKKSNNPFQYSELDKDGKLKLDAQAKRYDDVDGISMPYWIRVILAKEHKGVTIAYDEINLNKQVDCSFDVPVEKNN
jgi:outer membrane lipoprotein-sorting protein